MKSFKRHTWQILSFMIIPITIWLIIFNIYTINEVSKETLMQNYEDRLSLIVRDIENELSQTEAFMVPFINNTDFNIFGYYTNQDRLFDASQQIISLYQPLYNINSNLSGILIYSKPNDYYRIIVKDYVNSNDFVKYLKQVIADNSYSSRWYIAKVSNSQYFIRIMNVKGAYQMCFINMDHLFQSYIDDTSNKESLTAISDYTTYSVNKNDRFDKKSLNALRDKNSVNSSFLGIPYSYTKLHSDYLKLDFIYSSPYHLIITPTQIILILVSIILIVTLIPLGTLKFRKTCLMPLDSLTKTMNQIKEGEINARCHVDSEIYEYQRLGSTFNEMLEQIENLKIDSYEKTLEIQNTELQYRHMQIRPHFFLNCLKTLYGLAECRDYTKLQDLILSFSVYFRGIFGSAQMLSIKDELTLVSNYITLQKNCSILDISYQEYMDPRTENFMIPSLTVLTFIENSIKYGRRINMPLDICVKINLIEGDNSNYLNISITDNGPGFQNEEIQRLNSGIDTKYDTGTHIGIANIKKRCRLIYGEEATISFFHSNGAMIELFLPIKDEKERQV